VNWVKIDGSMGEGGGQVVRTSLALSAITGKSVLIRNVRARRTRPGLAAQHLTGVHAAQALCGAEVEGANLGSTELAFRPGPIRGGPYRFDVGTAGAITLVVQVIAPIALFADAPTSVTITGGTDVHWSPLADYCQGVFLAHLRQLGAQATLDVVRRGVYPKGGGEAHFQSAPWASGEKRAIDLSAAGSVARLEVQSLASQDLEPARVAERQIAGFERQANPGRWGSLTSQSTYARMRSTGTSLHARLVTDRSILGVCTVGVRGKPAERVGAEAAALLEAEWSSGAAVDRWMADQIIPFLGFLGGTVRTSAITQHTETNIQVVERFLPVRFDLEGTLIRARVTRPRGS
jgi:RNA 3'-phosphate cyclase